MQALLLVVSCAVAWAGQDAKTFGRVPTLAEPVSLSEVLERPAAFADREIALRGTALKVCKMKGCWLILRDGEKDIRVTFKDYAFFVPKDAHGRKVLAQGLVKETTLSAGEARHYLKDEGAPKSELRKVRGPVKAVAFVASGVAFLD